MTIRKKPKAAQPDERLIEEFNQLKNPRPLSLSELKASKKKTRLQKGPQ